MTTGIYLVNGTTVEKGESHGTLVKLTCRETGE